METSRHLNAIFRRVARDFICASATGFGVGVSVTRCGPSSYPPLRVYAPVKKLIPFYARFRFVWMKSSRARSGGGMKLNETTKAKIMKSNHTLKIRAIAGTAAVFLTACIPSVNPFYTAKEVRFDTQLLGEWQEKDDSKESWKFERGNDQNYKLTVTEKDNKQGTCDAVLFKLKNQLFLDIIPNDCKFAEQQADLVSASVFPGHLLLRISLLGSELKLALFDFDWLEKYLKEHPSALAHHLEGKRILLTAGTPELQRFVLQHLGEGELFQKYSEFVRR